MGNPLDSILKASEVGYDTENHTGQGPKAIPATFDMLAAVWNNMTADAYAKMTAMSKTVFCKRLEKLAESLREQTIPDANREWQAEYAKVVAAGQKIVTWDNAVFKKYSGRAKWEYPKAIQDMEARLKQAKSVSEKDGSAKNIKAAQDPLVDCMFTVTA